MKIERARITVRGAVQGVGFRPFVYRLAQDLQLAGWVNNSPAGVFLEVEGAQDRVNQFLLRLETDKPPRAVIQSLEYSLLDAAGYRSFEIRTSDVFGARTALILPDIAPCADCLREMFDPHNRRHLYPFTNCTHCGPRFSIIESLPYDRSNTSMKKFAMCPECQAEYLDPANRRFHAQPNACPACGPSLEFWNDSGEKVASRHEAFLHAADAIREGKIVALKSVGGFQLIVDARNEDAVLRLRHRKQREEKPFALLFPTLEMAAAACHMDGLEQRLLLSPEAPIVLLRRRNSPLTGAVPEIAPAVAPRNPWLGVMLPCSPLHHLLMRQLNFPVVATSGNLSSEPLCIDEREASVRLTSIVDVFLVHNRPIARPVDDSVTRVVMGREQILRRARGYAPLPVSIPVGDHARNLHAQAEPPHVGCYQSVLAVGAHLKNSIALAVDGNIFISQHIGDLETEPAHAAFQKTISDFKTLYGVQPAQMACDSHPEYLSTQFAWNQGMPVVSVQHHHAHVLACAAENEIRLPVLGVSWDGTGLGTDGKIWGGEFLLASRTGFRRTAHFREFPLPGNDAAVRQPRRSALGLLWKIFGDQVFEMNLPFAADHYTDLELPMLRKMLIHGINSALTTSAGRIFDAVASLVGLRQRNSFEGQAAMELEFSIEDGCDDSYPLDYCESEDGPVIIDWEPMILALLWDVKVERPVGVVAAKFHNAMVEAIVEIARRTGESKVAMSGGCFQNKYLLERSITRLKQAGFRPYWHQRVPTNDGGIAFGQIIAARNAHKPTETYSSHARTRGGSAEDGARRPRPQ